MRWLVGLLAAAALVLLLARIGLWEPSAKPQALAPIEVGPASAPSERQPELTRPTTQARRPERAEVAPAPAPKAAEAQKPAPARENNSRLRVLHSLRLNFVNPKRHTLRLKNVSLRFVDSEGYAYTFFARAPTFAIHCKLPRGEYRLTAEADGHRHVAETLRVGDRPRPMTEERLIFWPEDWIPIIVRTPDDRSFHALAEDLGLHPKRFFDQAFTVQVSSVPIPESGRIVPQSKRLATFRRPGGYQVTAIGDDVAGSLELHEYPPFWVGLWIHGGFYEARLLNPGDTQLVFTLDQAALDKRFASVTATLVDRDSGRGVREASATLKAERSAHRHRDLRNRSPDDTGRITFRRVIPGGHELTVTRGANLAQRRFKVGPGENVDLGEIQLAAGPGIRMRVVDSDGEPAQAIVELAPFEPGRRVSKLYHPNLWRVTKPDGSYDLPLPDRPSIVRCRPYTRSGGHSDVETVNTVVDPKDVPAELVMTLTGSFEFNFEPLTPWVKGHKLTIEDPLGLIITSTRSASGDIELVPNRYTVRRWEGERELGSIDVFAQAGGGTLRAP
jgi:hypothetical protein